MTSPSSELQWFLIHCKPHEDERALENLERQQFECFMPVRHVERLRCGRKLVRREPLFPRYLFIRLDSRNDNWYPIRSTRGVINIVRFNTHPIPVPDVVIEEIRTRLEHPRPAEPLLKPGERVRIVEGRVLSCNRPSKPSSMKRCCQRQVQVLDLAVRRMISLVPNP